MASLKALEVLHALSGLVVQSFEGDELEQMIRLIDEAEEKTKALPPESEQQEEILSCIMLVGFANITMGFRMGVDVSEMTLFPEPEEISGGPVSEGLQEMMGGDNRGIEDLIGILEKIGDNAKECMCAKCVMARAVSNTGGMPESWN